MSIYRLLITGIIIISVTLSVAAFFGIRAEKLFNSKVLALQTEVSNLQGIISEVSSSTKNVVISTSELQNRQLVVQKSQEELLTSAVAKISPAVVSIIISENAPKYKITYVNPFGDDPDFQGSGIRVPVYEQVGTELQKVGAGTGIIFSHDGYILTNKHVIFDANAQYVALLSNGSQKTAKVIYVDPSNDVAVIKIDGTYPSIASFGDSSKLKLGQTVAAIGNALGEYNNSVSVGIISGLNRNISAYDESGSLENLPNVIQTDAAINPGNSGGPLIDLNGNVIGLNVATAEGGSNIGFSIPINLAKTVISKY
jgi:serine protease Do